LAEGALRAQAGVTLQLLNDRPLRHLGASRRALFEELERSALKPLPNETLHLSRMEEM
jgi:hypothetical protein